MGSPIFPIIVLAALFLPFRCEGKRFKGFGDHPLITTVTGQTFQQVVVQPTLPVVMMVYSQTSTESAKTGPIFEAAATKLQGHALFAAFDGSTEEGKQLAEMFGVKSVPAFLIFNPDLQPVQMQGAQPGSYMKIPLTFNGKRTVSNLIRFVYQASSSTHITRLEDTIDWGAFSSLHANLDLPRVVLVTATNSTSPVFRASSHKYRYGALFAVVTNASLTPPVDPELDQLSQPEDEEPAGKKKKKKQSKKSQEASVQQQVLAESRYNLMKFFDVKELPSIVIVQGTDKPIVKAAKGMTLAELNKFVGDYALPEQKRFELTQFFLSYEENKRKKEIEAEKINKALPPLIIEDANEWETECVKRKEGVCIAVFSEEQYTGGKDSEPEQQRTIQWLTSAAKSMSQRSKIKAQIVMIHAWANPELATLFGAAEMGYPTAVIIDPKKKQFYNLIGAFSERGLVSFFIDRFPSMKGQRYDAKELPTWKATEHGEEEEGGEEASGSRDSVVVEDEL